MPIPALVAIESTVLKVGRSIKAARQKSGRQPAELTSPCGGYEVLVTASALSTPPTQAMLALSPIATEFPMSAETLGVIVQVRSPTVIDFELTAVTTPVC